MVPAIVVFAALASHPAEAQSPRIPIGASLMTVVPLSDDAAPVVPPGAALDALQPTSIVTGDFMRSTLPPQSDYGQAVGLTPSAVAIEQNGPGAAFAGQVSIRGFQDGQYNLTFDGIPVKDPADGTHRTTTTFMNRDLRSILIDRGPGTASTVGNPTLGGTIELNTKAPGTRTAVTPYAAYGSFNTTLYGGQVDTGRLPGGALVFDGERATTDGAIHGATAQRDNFFAKSVQPIGDSTTLTVVGLYNTNDQSLARGASRAQIAAFGPGAGFSNDPRLQNDSAYNRNKAQTDFSYLGIASQLSDIWSVENKLYTYGAAFKDTRGLDVSNTSFAGTAFSATNVPGALQTDVSRAYGDTLQVKRLLALGDLKFGTWIENQSHSASQANVDLSRGGILSPNAFTAFNYLDHEDVFTLQPYVELDIKPIPSLTVTPGVKYTYVQRSLHAAVNLGAFSPLKTVKAYGAPLPSVAGRYAINPALSVYAQFAQGFQTPSLNQIRNNAPSRSRIDPLQANIYQIGATYQRTGWSIAGDLYYADVSNVFAKSTLGLNTTDLAQGPADYYGVEGETTVGVGYGVNLFANGSVNAAKNRATGQPVANAPEATWAIGALYQRGNFGATLLNKWVGSRYGDVGLKQGLQPFNQFDAAFSYSVPRAAGPPASLKLQLNNVLDSRKIIQFDTYAGSRSTPLYYTQPGRSAFISLQFPI